MKVNAKEVVTKFFETPKGKAFKDQLDSWRFELEFLEDNPYPEQDEDEDYSDEFVIQGPIFNMHRLIDDDRQISLFPQPGQRGVRINLVDWGYSDDDNFFAIFEVNHYSDRYEGEERFERFVESLDHSLQKLSDVIDSPEIDYKVDDVVMYTNTDGVEFGPYTIIGFEKIPVYGRCVYLDMDSYWFPVKPEQLELVTR